MGDLWNETRSLLAEMNESYSGGTGGQMTSLVIKRTLPKWYYPILISTLTLSIVSLLVTIIIYAKLAEFKNIPGKNLISLSSCLILTYALLTLDFILNRRLNKSLCKSLAILTHLAFLSVFMWTNVLSFDIWRAVVSSNGPAHPASKTGRSKQYWKYALYAWVGTVILALPAIIVDASKVLSDGVSPSFATRRCWLNGTPAFLIYFNGPVGIILISNFTFFGLTARALIKIGKMTAKFNMSQHRKRLYLYLKLFVIMGMVWLSEFIPWMTGYFQLYMVAGIVTSLYGFLLFIIFICKKSVYRSLKREMGVRCFAWDRFCVKNGGKLTQLPSTVSQSTFKSYTTTNSTSLSNSQGNVSFNTSIV